MSGAKRPFKDKTNVSYGSMKTRSKTRQLSKDNARSKEGAAKQTSKSSSGNGISSNGEHVRTRKSRAKAEISARVTNNEEKNSKYQEAGTTSSIKQAAKSKLKRAKGKTSASTSNKFNDEKLTTQNPLHVRQIHCDDQEVATRKVSLKQSVEKLKLNKAKPKTSTSTSKNVNDEKLLSPTFAHLSRTVCGDEQIATPRSSNKLKSDLNGSSKSALDEFNDPKLKSPTFVHITRLRSVGKELEPVPSPKQLFGIKLRRSERLKENARNIMHEAPEESRKKAVPKEKTAKNKISSEIENKDVARENDGKKVLRLRKHINYHDVSQTPPQKENSILREKAANVPVYRKKLPESPKSKKLNIDIYEFFADDKHPRKRRKQRVSDSSFKIKERKKPKKENWQENVKSALEQIGLDVKSKTLSDDIVKLVKGKTVSNNPTLLNSNVVLAEAATNIQTNLNFSNSGSKVPIAIAGTSKNEMGVFNTPITPTRTFKSKSGATSVSDMHHNVNEALTAAERSSPAGNWIDQYDTNNESSESEFFKVPDSPNTKHTTDAKKVKILSEIIIPPPPEFGTNADASFIFSPAPLANSTMTSAPNMGFSGTPWRPPQPERYNPHFMKVKANALPSVEQSIILDASYVEKPQNQTIVIKSPVKQSNNVQQSILSFVSNKNEVVNPNSVSLFGIDEYSPFKSHSTQTDLNLSHDTTTNENIKNETNNRHERVKRNILKDASNIFQENNMEVTSANVRMPEVSLNIGNENDENTPPTANQTRSPKKHNGGLVPENAKRNDSVKMKFGNNPSSVKHSRSPKEKNKQNEKENAPVKHSNGVDNYFGFISDDESSEPTSDQKKKNQDSKKPDVGNKKPARIPVVLLVNIIKKINQKELIFIDECSNYNKSFEIDQHKNLSDSEEESDQDMQEEEDLEVPLFRDLKPKAPNKCYQRKVRITRRRWSVSSEEDHDVQKKRHKNMRAAKEEWNEEAERWAEQFNSVCKEVENYELDME